MGYGLCNIFAVARCTDMEPDQCFSIDCNSMFTIHLFNYNYSLQVTYIGSHRVKSELDFFFARRKYKLLQQVRRMCTINEAGPRPCIAWKILLESKILITSTMMFNSI